MSFMECYTSFKDMECIETVLVSGNSVKEAEVYNYEDLVNIPKYSVGCIKSFSSQATGWISNLVDLLIQRSLTKKL